MSLMAPGYHHEDLATGGIYTEAEMKSWAEKIMYGDLHSAIVKSLTLGICHNDREGVAGVLTAFYVLCCSSRISSERIIRKGRQKQKTEDHPLYEINKEHEGI